MTKSVEKVDGRLLRSQQTKQKLLQAARDVFLEAGFQTATISQIIKKAGVGYGTAYVHFKGKDDLLIVLMEDVMDSFYNIAEMEFTPRSIEEANDLIAKQTEAFLRMAQSERNMLHVFEEAMHMPPVAKKWKQIREEFINRIAQDITYSQKNGLAKQNMNPALIARGWFFSNEMYLWEIVRDEHKASIKEIAQTLTNIYTEGLYVN